MATYNGSSSGTNSFSTPDGFGVTIGPGEVDDTLFGNGGDDTLQGYSGSDFLFGGEGNDQIWGDTKSSGAVSLSDGGDYLYGGDGNDTLNGQAGDDYLDGGSGTNAIDGGDGVDFVAYISSTSAVTLNLAAGTISAGAYATDTVANVENAGGSHLGDTLTGDSGDNELTGFGGDDSIEGGDGSDTAVFTGAHDFYSVVLQPDGTVIVTDNRTQVQIEADSVDAIYQVSNGSDTLSGIEFLRFKDGTFDVSSFAPDDFADDPLDLTTPVGVLGFGVAASGDIEQVGDRDVFAIALEAGVQYALSLDSVTLGDPFLRLLDSSGNVVAFDDDSGGDLNSLITITIGTTGTYYLQAGGFSDVSNGTYLIASTILATAGGDTVSGTDQADSIQGLDGPDLIAAATGNDTLGGGDGNDSLFGDDNDDLLQGGAGADSLFGGADQDLLLGHVGDDGLFGGAGDDTLHGGIGTNLLNGGEGRDTALFNSLALAVTVDLRLVGPQNTGFGLDELVGIENLVSGDLDDVLSGNDEANRIEANGGDDRMPGWGGDDSLFGGLGDDTIGGGEGNDLIDGGDGEDTARFVVGGANVTVDLAIAGGQFTGFGFDTLVSIEHLQTGSGNDSLRGNAQNNRFAGTAGNDTLSTFGGQDTLNGGAGDDVLGGGRGNDTIDGGAGQDTADYALATKTIRVNLSLTGAQSTGAGIDTLFSIENVTTGTGDDRLIGSGGANRLVSGGGADRLIGGDGSDTLIGGAGSDTLVGGAGADSFVFDAALGIGNIDRVSDFQAGIDTFVLEQSIFAALGLGDLSDAAFRSNISGTARDATDRIIYDSDNGFLFYDADGLGGVARVLVATLQVGLSLSANDFFVQT